MPPPLCQPQSRCLPTTSGAWRLCGRRQQWRQLPFGVRWLTSRPLLWRGAASATDDGRIDVQQEEVRAARRRLIQVTTGMDPYPCEAAFGVPLADLRDARGVYVPARLLAAYYGRYPDLFKRLRTLLSPVTDEPPDLLNALAPAEALVITSRPLVTLRTARRVRALLHEMLNSDAVRLARPLRRLKLRVDRSAASHSGIVRAVRALDAAESDAERAEVKLDLYRRVAEGQLRPWAWTLLQICGRPAGRTPELSSLREQLLADEHPLLDDAAAAILPLVRNAAAHEDFAWNEERQALVVGEAEIGLAELEDATDRAYAFMYGCECAWACARAASPTLARLLDVEDPPSGLRAINERAALSYFGTNGLLVRNWRHEGGVFTVVLEDLPFSRINPCFQAVMWASRHLGATDRFCCYGPFSRRARRNIHCLAAGARDLRLDASKHVPSRQRLRETRGRATGFCCTRRSVVGAQ
jgi:hypothetical protein